MRKDYMRVAVTLFSAIGIGHAIRIYYGWDVSVSGFEIPIWFSWFAVIVALAMVTTGLKLMERMR